MTINFTAEIITQICEDYETYNTTNVGLFFLEDIAVINSSV